MKKEINKHMTIDQLARMVQKGFEETQADIKTVDQKIEILDHKLDDTRETLARSIKDLDLKLTATGALWRQDFARLDSRVNELHERLSLLEERPHRRSA